MTRRALRPLRAALAAVLACGLMLPTGALAAGATAGEAASAAAVSLAESAATPSTDDEDAAIPFASEASPKGNPGAGAFTIAEFTIWGVNGDSVSASDFAYDETAKTLTVNTDKHFAIQNTDLSEADSASIANQSWAVLQKAAPTRLIIPAGRDAHITLDNLRIQTAEPAILLDKGASAHLVLADNSGNYLASTGIYQAGIRCTEGSSLTIDDAVPNSGIVPEHGMVPRDATLENGMTVKAGDPLSVLESTNPGVLVARSHHGSGAGIGGNGPEPGGAMTFEGGIINASSGSQAQNYTNGANCSAGIGGGAGGSGTNQTDWITINGGRITATGGYHAAGIGGASYGSFGDSYLDSTYPVMNKVPAGCGNIRVNGGFSRSVGGTHGGGFGQGCACPHSNGFTIEINGGTLLPIGGTGDMGATGATVIVTGGSLGNERGAGGFKFGGTAQDAEGNTLKMVEIDLTADVGTSAYQLLDWDLLVDGKRYDYGAPAEFDKGHLYLWLPNDIVMNSEVTVGFTYLNTDKLDENGKPTEITPLPLFRPPGTGTDGKLRRYADFELPQEYLDKLRKYYDGKEFKAYTIDADNTLPTLEEIGKDPDTGKPIYRELTDGNAVTYKYQLFDRLPGGDAEPQAIGPEVDSGKTMPTDVGTMKFTMTSTEFSNTAGFKESYWGHRATGWCVIEPTNSAVALVDAQWVEDSAPGEEHHDSDKELRVNAQISRGKTDPAGVATKPTCAAPEGYVQLFVDGEAVGDPIEILFEDKPAATRAVTEAGKKNAERKGDDTAGHYTDFTYVFKPADADFLVPDATGDGKHEVSVQYLPPKSGDAAPANYLESANPAEDPEQALSDTVAINPIDPKPSITPDDPSNPAGTEIEVDPDPKPADPSKPNTTVYTGTIEATYQEHGEDEPNPGRVTLKLDTPSSGPITVTTEDGRIIEADVVRDDEGNPVRDADGKITLVVDPEAIGDTKLTVSQAPNGAYTGTVFEFDVTVKPNPQIAPETAVTKTAENLTHPDGPTQPGDRIRYIVKAANSAAGSAWNDVVLADPLPGCLELDGSTVRLANPSQDFDKKLASTTGTPKLGEYKLEAADADGKRTLAVPAGAVYGEGEATLTFECTVSADAAGRDIASNLANIAHATGTRPDPDKPSQELPENPDPSDPALPAGPATVVPADPSTTLSKTVENVANPDAKVTKPGDVLRYTVSLKNTGAANSCLIAAVIADPLPMGMEPVAGSLKLTLSDGREIAVDDSAYDRASRTIAVTAGDLWGGEEARLTFEVTVGADALGADNANVAFTHGTVPSIGPDSVPSNPEPGKPTAPPADEPTEGTEPVEPPVLVGTDPAEGDITVAKEAENTTRDDGKTSVGDVVRYTVTLKNDGPATSWMDAVIRDDVPAGLEPVSESIRMTLADGSEVEVSDDAYNDRTRILAVAAGHLYGGQAVTLVFDALVTEEALGADIGNTAVALGVPPSAWDPDGTHPEPGQPFDPPAGWSSFERESERVVSPTAYAPGTDKDGGVLPAEDGPDESTTIRAKRLAQTGDDLAAGFLLGAGLAMTAAIALFLSRRRLRRSR